MAATGEVGVGVLLNPSLDAFVADRLSSLDHVAVIPDRGWIDHGPSDIGPSASGRFEDLPASAALVARMASQRPVVLHGIGLSIGSADRFDEGYALNLIQRAERLGCLWLSEHLSFSRVGTTPETHAAFMLPVPHDREVLEMLIPRARFFTERANRPFLLENNVAYVRYRDQDMAEEDFLNALCRRSGCGLLLDLHNLHTNAVNHHFRAADYLARLDMTRVIEIHVAGGAPMMGFHTDSHTGPVLEEVWDLLAQAAPAAPNLRGVTFEFHESSFGLLGDEGVLEQVGRARSLTQERVLVSDVPARLSARRR